MKLDPLGDEKSLVEPLWIPTPLKGEPDLDLIPVNAARASFDREHTSMDDSDSKLINFLARENHIHPFAHLNVGFRFKAPIFVARQLAKHQVGAVISEASLRYIKPSGDFYIPEEFREQDENVKQGSKDTPVKSNDVARNMVTGISRQCFETYKYLVDTGVCREQARMVLPLNTYVTWVWTGSLLMWSRMYHLRAADDTQWETRQYAFAVGEVMSDLVPVSWKALTEGA